MVMESDSSPIREVIDGVVTMVGDSVKTVGDTIKNNKKEEEQTKRKKAEEEQATKRKKAEEENDAIRHSTTAKKENRASEIHANENIANQSTSNIKDVAIDTVTGSLEIAGNATDKIAEAGNKTLDHIKEMAGTGAQSLIDIQERHQNNLEEKDREFKVEIKKAQKEIREYQGLLQYASIEITKYRTTQEVYSQFSQNTLSFAEAEAKHSQKVSNTKNTIDRKKRELQPLHNDLQDVKTKIAVSESDYENLHHKFDKQIYSLELLKYEYKESMEESKYCEAYQGKERKLKRLLDEIEQKEMELLNRERDRLDKAEEMEPMLQALKEHEIALKYLEEEHRNLISAGLLKLGNPQIENKNSNETGEVIETQIYEKPKSDKLLT